MEKIQKLTKWNDAGGNTKRDSFLQPLFATSVTSQNGTSSLCQQPDVPARRSSGEWDAPRWRRAFSGESDNFEKTSDAVIRESKKAEYSAAVAAAAAQSSQYQTQKQPSSGSKDSSSADARLEAGNSTKSDSKSLESQGPRRQYLEQLVKINGVRISGKLKECSPPAAPSTSEKLLVETGKSSTARETLEAKFRKFEEKTGMKRRSTEDEVETSVVIEQKLEKLKQQRTENPFAEFANAVASVSSTSSSAATSVASRQQSHEEVQNKLSTSPSSNGSPTLNVNHSTNHNGFCTPSESVAGTKVPSPIPLPSGQEIQKKQPDDNPIVPLVLSTTGQESNTGSTSTIRDAHDKTKNEAIANQSPADDSKEIGNDDEGDVETNDYPPPAASSIDWLHLAYDTYEVKVSESWKERFDKLGLKLGKSRRPRSKARKEQKEEDIEVKLKKLDERRKVNPFPDFVVASSSTTMSIHEKRPTNAQKGGEGSSFNRFPNPNYHPSSASRPLKLTPDRDVTLHMEHLKSLKNSTQSHRPPSRLSHHSSLSSYSSSTNTSKSGRSSAAGNNSTTPKSSAAENSKKKHSSKRSSDQISPGPSDHKVKSEKRKKERGIEKGADGSSSKKSHKRKSNEMSSNCSEPSTSYQSPVGQAKAKKDEKRDKKKKKDEQVQKEESAKKAKKESKKSPKEQKKDVVDESTPKVKKPRGRPKKIHTEDNKKPKKPEKKIKEPSDSDDDDEEEYVVQNKKQKLSQVEEDHLLALKIAGSMYDSVRSRRQKQEQQKTETLDKIRKKNDDDKPRRVLIESSDESDGAGPSTSTA